MGEKGERKDRPRYHITQTINGHVYGPESHMEGVTPYMDRSIADALAGANDAKVTVCKKKRCHICAERGWSLDVYYEVGSYIIQTFGEYSDYGLGSLFRVTKRFPPEQFKSLAAAKEAGRVEELEFREWWNG